MPEEVVTTAPAEEVAPATNPAEGAAPVQATPPPIVIDGTEYTLEDVRSGMLRQADYTRKTQDLAAERQQLAQANALWSALAEDPAGAIEALQEHFAEQLVPVEPEDAFKREVTSFMQSQQEQQAVANVNAELYRLGGVHGAFDHDALLQFAIDRNIPSLEDALILQRALNPQVTAQAAQAAADAAALAAKQALPAVAGGSHAAGATEGNAAPITSVKGALAAALAEAGLDSLSSLE